MSLTVETGQGLPDAESYLSVADADAYHTRFGNTSWTGTTPEKEIALRRATQYIDATYGLRWQGQRVNSVQALDWPRYDVVTRDGYVLDSTTLPQALKDATAEMAIACLEEDPMPSPDVNAEIKKERFKVGPIEEETEYVDGKSETTYHRKVSSLLTPLLMTASQGYVERG